MLKILSKWFKKATEIPELEGSDFIKKGRANYFEGMLAIGGRLVLTKNTLYFKSHNILQKNMLLKIETINIKEALLGKSLGILSNRLILKMKDDTTKTFIVIDNKDWKKQIDNNKK